MTAHPTLANSGAVRTLPTQPDLCYLYVLPNGNLAIGGGSHIILINPANNFAIAQENIQVDALIDSDQDLVDRLNTLFPPPPVP